MTTQSIWQSDPERVKVDVAVVGGGVIGASTAYALSQLDSTLRIGLLERSSSIAPEASGRNAGFLLPSAEPRLTASENPADRDRARRLWAFGRENLDIIDRECSTWDVDYLPSGSYLAAGSDNEAKDLKWFSGILGEWGEECPFIEGPRVEEATGLVGFPGALRFPMGGAIHPVRLVNALVGRSGCRMFLGREVKTVDSASDHFLLVGDWGQIEAGRVAFATNAFAPSIVESLSDLVRPVRAQMLATAPAPLRMPTPVYSHEGFFYIRQRADGRYLVGGARHLHEAEEVGYEDTITDALQNDLEAYLREHLPGDVPFIERRWSGVMGFSPDGLPIAGEMEPGLVFGVGFTGHGMGYSLRFGRLLARMVLEFHDEAADLFSAERSTSVTQAR